MYEEFLKTGIDKDSHWKLRQAEYDIHVSLENYRASTTRVYEEARQRVGEIRAYLVNQKASSQPNTWPKDQFQGVRAIVAGVRLLYSVGSEELRSLEADLALSAPIGPLSVWKNGLTRPREGGFHHDLGMREGMVNGVGVRDCDARVQDHPIGR